MRKFFRNLGIISLICFSFYFTEKTISVIEDADEIMIEIKNRQDLYYQKPIEGIVDNDTFVPGISGKKVNIEKSYKKIKQYGMFNDSLLVYDDVKPNNQLNNNLDKYIIGGNSLKKQVSIILTVDSSNYLDEVLKILNDKNINVNFFIGGTWLEENTNYLLNFINNGHDIGSMSYNMDYTDSSYPWMDNKIKKATKEENSYCYNITDNENTLNMCSRYNNYTIRPNIILDNNYLKNIKEQLKAGSIISLPLEKEVVRLLPAICNYIKSKGLEIVTLKDLLKED